MYKFKAGTFIARDGVHANDVEEIIVGCARAGVSFARSTRFVMAVSCVCRVDDFDRDLFLARVEKNTGMMVAQPTRDTYVSLIEQVYNYQGGRNSRLAIAFLAKDASAKRNVCGLTNKK